MRNYVAIRSMALIIIVSYSLDLSAEPLNGTWFLSVDNDSFAGADDDHTSGIQIGWVSGYLKQVREGQVPAFLVTGTGHLPFVNREVRQRFICPDIHP